ncbi:hypothetical protein C5E45_32720 [Nocardia nova]|uniref:Uncharacterized protein n=1 Tax=Nocardia nova TaxID=37330 RepID=A0A2S6ACP9_9NOCA|nr:hypothetical protein [Nocardia nova]PPJ31856.1 hypothetical protein C5E45_32720 [Nocardia nova]
MSDVVIEVSVPQTADIEAVADTVDVTADPTGAPVIVVAAPGPPGELAPEDLAEVVDDVLNELTPPINLVLLFENSLA